MGGEMIEDIDRRHRQRLIAAAVLLDRQDRHGLGGVQERQRVVQGAGGFPAAVPGDEHLAADIGIIAGIGDDQNRTTRIEHDLFDQILGGLVVFGPRMIVLAENGEIGIAAADHGFADDVPVFAIRKLPPLPGDAGFGRTGQEQRLGFVGGIAQRLARPAGDDAGAVGFALSKQAGQAGIEALGKLDGNVQPDGTARPGIHMNQNILQRHGSPSLSLSVSEPFCFMSKR
jgi:hypothetical protein